MPNVLAGIVEAAIDIAAAVDNAIAVSFAAVGIAGAAPAVASVVGGGILALGGASGLGAAIGAWAVVGTVAELAFYKPKLNQNGSPQQFKADTNAPIPVVEGHYGVGGNIVYMTTSGGSNKAAAGAAGNEYLTACVVLSGLGPIQGFDTLKFNDTILKWSGQECTGGYIPADTIGAYNVPYHNNGDGTYENDQYNNHAWQNLQLGALSETYFAPPDKLTSDNAQLTEWDATHGLSGFAASFLTIVYDQTVYAGGQPKPLYTLDGIFKYDPRQDSTYPGGSGPQRWAGQGASAATLLAARASYAYNTNPFISALNYALGYWLPDDNGVAQLYAGTGTPYQGVDIDAFVACANIADANGWTLNGQWTTNDDPWSVLVAMCQCGGGAPTDRDGRISCIINTPLTSLGTITNNDLAGAVAVDTQAAIKTRINRVWPRFRSEPHNFDMVPVTEPIFSSTYVSEDGGRYRDKQLDYEFVTGVNQCCQLAAYDIANSREGIVAVIPGKPSMANYRVGDAVTVDIAEAGLSNIKMMVIKRSPDFQQGGVTLTLRSETDAKHPWALGQSGVAPATPTITGVDPAYVGAPLPDFWATGALTLSDLTTGESTDVIQITGSSADNVYAQVLLVRYGKVTALAGGGWTTVADNAWTYTSFASSQGQFNLDLNPGSYDVQIAYQTTNGAGPSSDANWLDLGVETVGGSTSANTAAVGVMSATAVNAQLTALTPAADTAAPATQGQPTVSFSTSLDANGNFIVTLTGTTTANVSPNVAGYEFALQVATGPVVIYPTKGLSYSWPIPAGATYSVSVAAVKISGVVGGFSPAQTGVAPTNTTQPPQLTGLGATTAINASTGLPYILWTWTASAVSDLSAYTIYISDDGGASYFPFSAGKTNSYKQENLVSGQTYMAKVIATNTSLNASIYSAVYSIVAATNTVAPNPVTSPNVVSAFVSAFLTWTNPTANINGQPLVALKGVQVWQNTTNSFSGAALIATPNAAVGQPGSFTVTGLTVLTPLYFWLVAVDTSGNSAAPVYAGSAAPPQVTTAQLNVADLIAKNFLADVATVGVLNANVLKSGTSLPYGLTLSNTGYTLEEVSANAATGISNAAAAQSTANSAAATAGSALYLAQNPVQTINAGSTVIQAGLVDIFGNSTLSSWRNGANSTAINGGAIAANTINANSLQIGARGCSFGPNFQVQANATGVGTTSPTANAFAWSSDYLYYTDNTGALQAQLIPAGSQSGCTTGTYYFLYWTYGATSLSVTNSYATANAPNNLLIASYVGGGLVTTYLGGTIIGAGGIAANAISTINIQTQSLVGTEFAASAQISVGSGSNGATLSGSDPSYAIWAGSQSSVSAPFQVGYNGAVNASALNIRLTNGTLIFSSSTGFTPAGITLLNSTTGARVSQVAQSVVQAASAGAASVLDVQLGATANLAVAMSYPISELAYYGVNVGTSSSFPASPSQQFPASLSFTVYYRYSTDNATWGGWNSVASQTWTRNAYPTPATAPTSLPSNQYAVLTYYGRSKNSSGQDISTLAESATAPANLTLSANLSGAVAGYYEFCVVASGATDASFEAINPTIQVNDTTGSDLIVGVSGTASAGSGGSPGTFLYLTDTPSSYTGAANDVVLVNPSGTGLIFAQQSSLSVGYAANSGQIAGASPSSFGLGLLGGSQASVQSALGLGSNAYTSTPYAPLSGGGAYGTWGINVTGSAGFASSASVTVYQGQVASYTTSAGSPGLTVLGAYNNGYPTPYGNVLNVFGGGANQLLMSWSGTTGGYASLYFRSLRDLAVGTSGWSAWATVLDNQNYSAYALPLTGGALSGSLSLTSSLTINRSPLYFAGAADPNHVIGNGLDSFFGSSDGETFSVWRFFNLKSNYNSNVPNRSIIFADGNTGYVGVNISSPAYTLDVYGSGKFSNNIRSYNTFDIFGNNTGQFAAINNNTFASFYNDGSNIYILKSASSNTNFDSHRPFIVNLSSGYVTIDETGCGSTLGGNVIVQGQSIFGQKIAVGTPPTVDTSMIRCTGDIYMDSPVSSLTFNAYYNNGWYLRQPGYGSIIRSDNAGNLAIFGTLNGSANQNVNPSVIAAFNLNGLTVVGSIVASGNVTGYSVTGYSDRRLKDKITPIRNPLQIIQRLRGVRYVEKRSGAAGIGYVAQELEPWVPEVVLLNPDTGMYSIDYGRMSALLTEGVKVLSEKVDAFIARQEQITAANDARFHVLQSRIGHLEVKMAS